MKIISFGKKNCDQQSANNQVRDKVTENENHSPLQLHHETMGGMLILSESTEIIKLQITGLISLAAFPPPKPLNKEIIAIHNFEY